MEILNPSPPPSPSIERFIMVGRHSRIVGSTGGSPSSAAGRIHVAVGRSPEKTLGLLRWAFRRFGCTEVVLVHVYQPSLLIPTLLGKIPVNQATEEVVKSHRRSEKKETKKILSSYMNYCHKSKVRATIIVTESDQIQNGIVYLINSHGIRQLVMGSAPDNCFKLKGGSSKATFIAKYTPPFCEIWFVSKGRHIWTREASSDYNPDDIMLRKRSRFSLDSSSTESECDNGETEQPRREHVDQVHLEFCKSNVSDSSNNNSDETLFLSGSPPSSPDSPVDHKISSKLFSKGFVSDNLNEIMVDSEKSRTTAFSDLVKRKKIENQISEILKRVQASEDARACETKLREERDSQLKETKEHHQNILNEKEKALKELESKMTKLSLLELRVQHLLLRHEEANAELDALQSSIEYLLLERTKHAPTGGGVKELKRFSGRHIRAPHYNFLGLGENNNHNFKEFSSSDIQAATCNFSESFKLGQGGNGCVYKGEIMNRSVVIKKLHPHNGHGSIEFQQEVFVLSKLTHPHLVTLYGACPESLCIVYEYLPNGTLQERLFSKRTNSPSLTWRTRCRLVYEIASALLFLHSSKPDKIVHGDLKPNNILLDSELRCKIGDFGISRLVSEDRDKSEFMVFRRNTGPRGSFPYTDPELLQGGHEARNPKCDVYSFGIIILQLLTGKLPLGLANEVRRAVSNGQVAAVLDGEWPADVARRLVEFGLRCCEMNGRDRPDLTPEIVRELGQLHLMKERHVPSFFLCPILQDIMHDPQVAADGFTYEGRALRDWLENGRETSPMTNLKLEHLNLTPNHALRFAIQDWLCQS